MPISDIAGSQTLPKLYQIIHQIDMNPFLNQHESKTPLAFVVLGSRSRSDGILEDLEGGMLCGESCHPRLFLVVDGLPLDEVKSSPYRS